MTTESITDEVYWKLAQVQSAVFIGKVRAIGRDFQHMAIELPYKSRQRVLPFERQINANLRHLVAIYELINEAAPPPTAGAFHRRFLRVMRRCIKLLTTAFVMMNTGRYDQLGTLTPALDKVNRELTRVTREAWKDDCPPSVDLSVPIEPVT